MPDPGGIDDAGSPAGGRSYTSRLSSRGQIVIPKALRELVGLKEGMVVVFETGEDGTVILRKGLGKSPQLDVLFGAWEAEGEVVQGRAKALRRPTLERLALDAEDQDHGDID